MRDHGSEDAPYDGPAWVATALGSGRRAGLPEDGCPERATAGLPLEASA